MFDLNSKPMNYEETTYFSSGKVKSRHHFNADNRLDRSYLTGPAAIEFYRNGNISEISYCSDGKMDRPVDSGPAYESFYDDGQILCRQYWENGLMHRPVEQGPASQTFHPDGRSNLKYYKVRGKKVELPVDSGQPSQ